MKRGNTALKRVVSVASVAAMAIAGAVLAAPAASAATPLATANLSVRTQPIADSLLVAPTTGALITNVGQYNTNVAATAVYGAAAGDVPTGQAANVGIGSSQTASNIQIAVVGAVTADSTFTLTLNNGATWSSASANSTAQALVPSTLDSAAGYVNTAKVLGIQQATLPPLETATATNTLSTTSLGTSVNSNGDVLTLQFKAAATPTTATNAFLVTVSGVKINVAADKAAAGPVTATVGGVGAANATTIAYVNPFELRIPADTGYAANSKDPVALPDVTVVETANQGFAAGQVFKLGAVDQNEAVTGTAPSLGKAADSTVTPSSKLDLGATEGVKVNTGTLPTVATVTSDNNDYRSSFTVAGLNFSGLKAGADLAISLDGPTATSGDTASSWAHTAAQQSTGVTVTVKSTSSEARIAGSSRYVTAQKIAALLVKEGEGTNVILANGTTLKNGADALSANFLAGAEGNAPILLTDSSDTLPSATVDALKYLFKDSAGTSSTVNLFIMGKADSVSEKAAATAEQTIKDAVNAAVSKVNVVRVQGDDRYETSAATATQANKDDSNAIQSYDLGSGSLKTAFVASGLVNADALAAGGFSAGAGIPVLLVDGDTVNAKVSDAVTALGIQQLVVLGGTDRVSDKAIDTLKTDNGVKNVVRVAGSGSLGRYNTAALLNTFAYGTGAAQLNIGWNANTAVYLANAMPGAASGFADALTVGPLAGANKSVVLTTPKDTLPDLAKSFLTTNSSHLGSVTALGASDRIDASVITAAQLAIQ